MSKIPTKKYSDPVCPRKLSDCNKELEVALRQQAKTAEEDAQALMPRRFSGSFQH